MMLTCCELILPQVNATYVWAYSPQSAAGAATLTKVNTSTGEAITKGLTAHVPSSLTALTVIPGTHMNRHTPTFILKLRTATAPAVRVLSDGLYICLLLWTAVHHLCLRVLRVAAVCLLIYARLPCRHRAGGRPAGGADGGQEVPAAAAGRGVAAQGAKDSHPQAVGLSGTYRTQHVHLAVLYFGSKDRCCHGAEHRRNRTR